MDDNGEHADLDSLQASIIAIHAEIKAVCSDVRIELNNFRDTFERQMKGELGNFREEVNKNLSETGTELKDRAGRDEEVEQRVCDIEERTAEAQELLLQTVQIQDDMQAKLTDLEARSRRNNIRVHGFSKGANLQEFLEKCIKTELSLLHLNLGI